MEFNINTIFIFIRIFDIYYTFTSYNINIFLGRITLINKDKRLFCVSIEDDEYIIVEYFDDNDISENDLILARNTLGDAFIKNETTDKYFQGKIRYLGLSESKMKKVING